MRYTSVNHKPATRPLLTSVFVFQRAAQTNSNFPLHTVSSIKNKQKTLYKLLATAVAIKNMSPSTPSQRSLSPFLAATAANTTTTTTTCIIIWLLLAHALGPIQMRRLQRCELAGQLYILDVPKSELSLWLCIAEYESRYNTHVVGNRNGDGSSDYGLFQISSRYWCQPDTAVVKYYAFNECNVNYSTLLQDDITEAVECARTIQRRQGWGAWSVYSAYCNRTLTKVNDCFE